MLCGFHAESLNQEHGWEIKIHIDAASGGFIAPFQYPDLLWCMHVLVDIRTYDTVPHSARKLRMMGRSAAS